MLRTTLSSRSAFLALGVTTLGLLLSSTAMADPWTFGVMGDTQWLGTADAADQNSVPGSIISQVDQQFINSGVKFVVQPGDLGDNGTAASINQRAAYAQPLLNAGIGFFVLPGNHDATAAASGAIPTALPQTLGTANTFGATNFNLASTAGVNSLSYSFDYNNAKIVMVDQFPSAGTSNSNLTNVGTQTNWLNNTLQNKSTDNGQAFVFSHKNLVGQDHHDNLFGASAQPQNQDPTTQNAFYSTLANNGVRYYVSGHDHMHDRSLITSPDGTSQVQQLITQSDSNKFYTPGGGTTPRQTPISQQATSNGGNSANIGYYTYTLDGPKVTVNYFSAPVSAPGGGFTTTPTLNFKWQESWGYSLNGREFTVAQGQNYNAATRVSGVVAASAGQPAGIQDSFTGASGNVTTAKIIDGGNTTTTKDGNGRALTQVVDTGWTDRTQLHGGNLRSDMLTLWGMQSALGSDQTPTYVLAMTFDPTGLTWTDLADGSVAIESKTPDGDWVNAVDLNYGGTSHFVLGAYDPTKDFILGYYGIDPTTDTAWSVLNHASDFAVGVPEPGTLAMLVPGLGLLGFVARGRRRV